MRFVLGFIQKLPLGPMIIWSQLIQSTGPLQKITQLKKKKKKQWQILTQATPLGA